MKRFTFTPRRRIEACRWMQAVVLGVLLAMTGGGEVQAKSYTFLPLGFHNTACSGWEWVEDPTTQTVSFTGTINSDSDVSGEFWYEHPDRWSRHARQTGSTYQRTLPNPQRGWYQLCWSHTTAGNQQATGTLTTTVLDGADLTDETCKDEILMVVIEVENMSSEELFAKGCTLADATHDTSATDREAAFQDRLAALTDAGILTNAASFLLAIPVGTMVCCPNPEDLVNIPGSAVDEAMDSHHTPSNSTEEDVIVQYDSGDGWGFELSTGKIKEILGGVVQGPVDVVTDLGKAVAWVTTSHWRMLLWPEETLAENEQIFQQVCTGMKNFWNDPFGWYGDTCKEYGEMSDGEWVRGLSAEATCEIVGVGLGRYVDEMADMARAADNVTGVGTKVDDVVEGGAQGVDEAGSGVQRTNDVGGRVSGNHNQPMSRDSAGLPSQQPDELQVDLEGSTRIEGEAPVTVDTGPRKKYKFRDSTDARLRERFPEAFDDSGRVRRIEVDGKIVYLYNRNHVVADELSRSIIENCLNSATSRTQQVRILRELGYDPARFGGSIEDAAKAWRRDVYNKDSNLWMGDAAENQAKGSEIPRSDGNIMDADGKESPRVDPNPTDR